MNTQIQPRKKMDVELKVKIKKDFNPIINELEDINAKYLDDRLSKIKQIKIPTRIKNYRETFALYMACFKNRNKLQKYLFLCT